MENSKDFVVYLHERYGLTKEKMIKNSTKYCNLLGNNFGYEERGSATMMQNVDYDKLYVGARLWLDINPINKLGAVYEEIEVTHLHAGVVFYKQLTGKGASDEEKYFSQHSFIMYAQVYPKVIYKPKAMNLTCDCEKVKILDYPDEI